MDVEERPSNSTIRSTCFICNQDILNSDPVTIDLVTVTDTVSKCICKLFSLTSGLKASNFSVELYCSKCQEMFETISIIYEELDKLTQELDDRRRFIQSQLRSSCYYNANQYEGIADRARLELRRSLIDNESHSKKPEFDPDPGPDSSHQEESNRTSTQSESFGLGGTGINAPEPEHIEIKVEPHDDYGGGGSEYEDAVGEEEGAWTDPDQDTILLNQPRVKLSRIGILEAVIRSSHERIQNENCTMKMKAPEDGEYHHRAMKKEMDKSLIRSMRTRFKQNNQFRQYFVDEGESLVDDNFQEQSNEDDNDEEDEDEDNSDDNDNEFPEPHEVHQRRKPCPKSREFDPHEFRCKYCRKNCYCASKLERHENSHSDEKKFTCKVCLKPFKTRFAAMNHEVTHAPTADGPIHKPYKCPVCPNDYFSQRGLRKHMSRLHKNYSKTKNSVPGGGKKDRNYATADADSGGGKKTQGPKVYACSICGKTCKSPYDLNYHEESHKPNHERRHVCSVCGKGFFKQSVLHRHQLKHAASDLLDGPLGLSGLSLCQICGKYVTQLKTHMRSHTGEKLYPCKLCDRRFGTRESVRVHSRIHTGEKPFDCSTCGMKFRTSQSYRRHTKVHMSEKSYVCDYCGKAFRLKQSLREHTHVHTKEAPHRCNICGKRFAEQSLLGQHLNQDHTAEQIERKKKGSGARRRREDCQIQFQPQIPLLGKREMPFEHVHPMGQGQSLLHEDNSSSSASTQSGRVPIPIPVGSGGRSLTEAELLGQRPAFVGHSSSSTNLFPPYFPFTTAPNHHHNY